MPPGGKGGFTFRKEKTNERQTKVKSKERQTKVKRKSIATKLFGVSLFFVGLAFVFLLLSFSFFFLVFSFPFLFLSFPFLFVYSDYSERPLRSPVCRRHCVSSGREYLKGWRPVPPAPCRDRQGWCTDWLARSGWQKIAEGREKGGRREEEGRQEQGRGREEEGGREERGTFLWSLGSRGVPWELSSGAWVVSGGPRGFQGCSLGTPGGCLGGLGLSPGGLGMSFEVRWCPWSQNGRF